MTPIQALNFLNQIAAQAPVPRNTHAQAQEAVEILKRAITPQTAPPATDPKANAINNVVSNLKNKKAKTDSAEL